MLIEKEVIEQLEDLKKKINYLENIDQMSDTEKCDLNSYYTSKACLGWVLGTNAGPFGFPYVNYVKNTPKKEIQKNVKFDINSLKTKHPEIVKLILQEASIKKIKLSDFDLCLVDFYDTSVEISFEHKVKEFFRFDLTLEFKKNSWIVELSEVGQMD